MSAEAGPGRTDVVVSDVSFGTAIAAIGGAFVWSVLASPGARSNGGGDGGQGAARAIGWTLAGIALGAFAASTYFGAAGKVEIDDLRQNCLGHCSSSQVKEAWNKLVVADGLLAASVVAGGAGIGLLYWVAPSSDSTRPRSSAGAVRTAPEARLAFRFVF
jgi:hypothetical protein